MGAGMGQHQLGVLADQVRVRPDISVLNEIKVQTPCTPTGFANAPVISLEPVELREQGEGRQSGSCEDDSVEVDRLFGTAHRVTLEQLGDRGDPHSIDVGQLPNNSLERRLHSAEVGAKGDHDRLVTTALDHHLDVTERHCDRGLRLMDRDLDGLHQRSPQGSRRDPLRQRLDQSSGGPVISATMSEATSA